MAERKGSKIQIGQVRKQAEETGKLLRETRQLVEERFVTESTLRILGQAFIGSRQLAVAGPDGVELRDWTMAEIHRTMDDLQEKQESEIRGRLNEELIVATTWQENYFSEKRFRGKNRHFVLESQQVTDLVRSLLSEFSRSKEDLTYPWVLEMTEDRYAAEAVEVIRRTVLKPTYILMEGPAEGPITSIPSYNENEFWQNYEEQLQGIKSGLENPDDIDSLRQAQKETALHNPAEYSPEEWRRILAKEKRYLHEYLTSRARRAYSKFAETVGYAESLYDGRKKVYHAKDVKEFIKNNRLTGFATYCMQGITDFEGVIPTFEQTFGMKVGFQDILTMTDSPYYNLRYIRPNPAVATNLA